MKVADNHVVVIHYTLTGDDGAVLDSSSGRDPLTYLHGAQNIVSGLEAALAGKIAGDNVAVTVQPEEGYGAVQPELVQTVPREAFEGIEDVQPGMQFQARDAQGDTRVVSVREIVDAGIVVDGNHPLAGKVLHFDVSVESVREATEGEIAHGHAH